MLTLTEKPLGLFILLTGNALGCIFVGMAKVNKKVTIEDLARMVAKGFEETSKKTDTDRQFADVGRHLDLLEKQVENVKGLIVLDHKRRIEKLELDMKELKNALAM